MKPSKTKAILVLVVIYTILGIYFLYGTADALEHILGHEEPKVNYPAQDLVYIAVIDGFKVPVTIPLGSLNDDQRGKTWQTKQQYDADWERAMKWVGEILEEEGQTE